MTNVSRPVTVPFTGDPMRYSNPDLARESVQDLAVRHVLVQFCGQYLDAAAIEKMNAMIAHEMQKGPQSWAFR